MSWNGGTPGMPSKGPRPKPQLGQRQFAAWHRLPDGRHVVDVDRPGELRDAVTRALRGSGVDATLGLHQLVAKYADELDRVHDEAGRAAVSAWLEARR